VRVAESTLAYELMSLEVKVRHVPSTTVSLLREILEDASSAAAAVNSTPQTRRDALAVLEAIQISLAQHNLVQPPEEKDWPQTMSAALVALALAPEKRREVLEYGTNQRRSKYISPDGALYYVDCDMGAQLFLAVGEMLGWDIRLAEIPRHNFVRWHLSQTEAVNWDWTRWASLSDEDYRASIPPSDDPRLQALYVRSLTPNETRAYYVGLIAGETPQAAEAEDLFLQAVGSLPNHPLTLNNFAWFYATHPQIALQQRKRALPYALTAWSLRPASSNYADTVACSFAASAEREVALAIEDFAVENAPGQAEGYRANRKLIADGKLCNP